MPTRMDAAYPDAPAQNRFFLKKPALASQNSAAAGDRCRRNLLAYTSRNSASFDLAKMAKNSSNVSALTPAILSSSSAFWRGLRSAATTFSAPSSAMSSTLQPPDVSIRIVSLVPLAPMSSSSASMRGSSHATL